MDLNDFGTQCDSAPRQAASDNAFYHAERNFTPPDSPTAPIQWKAALPGVFEACVGLTLRELGAMERSLTMSVASIYHGRLKYPEQRSA